MAVMASTGGGMSAVYHMEVVVAVTNGRLGGATEGFDRALGVSSVERSAEGLTPRARRGLWHLGTDLLRPIRSTAAEAGSGNRRARCERASVANSGQCGDNYWFDRRRLREYDIVNIRPPLQPEYQVKPSIPQTGLGTSQLFGSAMPNLFNIGIQVEGPKWLGLLNS